MGRGGSNPPSDTPTTCGDRRSPGSDLRPPGLSFPQYFPASYSASGSVAGCSIAQSVTSAHSPSAVAISSRVAPSDRIFLTVASVSRIPVSFAEQHVAVLRDQHRAAEPVCGRLLERMSQALLGHQPRSAGGSTWAGPPGTAPQPSACRLRRCIPPAACTQSPTPREADEPPASHFDPADSSHDRARPSRCGWMTACCVVRHPNASPAGAVRASTSSNWTAGSPCGAAPGAAVGWTTSGSRRALSTGCSCRCRPLPEDHRDRPRGLAPSRRKGLGRTSPSSVYPAGRRVCLG
jgi:hypothetical protein